MASLSETGSWKSSGRVLGRKGILSTNTALGGPDGCVSKRLRLALGRSLRWLPPAYDGGKAFCQRTQRLVVPMAACQNGYVLHWAGRFVGFLLPMMAVGFDYFGDGFWWHVTHALLGPLVPAQHPLAVLGVADWNSASSAESV